VDLAFDGGAYRRMTVFGEVAPSGIGVHEVARGGRRK
jgi:hypothetical protein